MDGGNIPRLTASEEEDHRERRIEREQSYAVILMVSVATCSGLAELAPSGGALLRLRAPSVEPTLEAE